MSGSSVTQRINEAEARAMLPELVALLQDAVDRGASIGFLRPLARGVAEEYWQSIIRDVADNARVLVVVREGNAVLGSVQLGLCQKPNALHRAEVQKLIVHSDARRRGFGQILMAAIEAEARSAKRTLLYLDTEPDQPAELLYRKLGWTLAGSIPDYACTPDGVVHPTAIYYKRLGSSVG
jgi:acetyltransferase